MPRLFNISKRWQLQRIRVTGVDLMAMFEIGKGQVRVRFRMPKDPKAAMFDTNKTFRTVEDAENFIQENKDWLVDAYIYRVWEQVVSHYKDGYKV